MDLTKLTNHLSIKVAAYGERAKRINFADFNFFDGVRMSPSVMVTAKVGYGGPTCDVYVFMNQE